MKLMNVRLSYPALFEPKTFPGADQSSAKFQAAFLIPKTDTATIKMLQDAMKFEAQTKWGPKADAIYNQLVAQDRVCMRDGDMKTDSDGYENMMYITSSAGAQPTILDRDKTPLGPKAGRPYGGCYVNAVIDLWAQDNQYGKRINATLRGVQFAKDGDAFAASAPASPDDFDDLAVDGETDDLM